MANSFGQPGRRIRVWPRLATARGGAVSPVCHVNAVSALDRVGFWYWQHQRIKAELPRGYTMAQQRAERGSAMARWRWSGDGRCSCT